VEIFNLRKISDMEFRKPYQIKITNRIAVLENLNDSEGIYRVWQNSQDNIETSAKWSLGLCEVKQHKPRFDEECLRFLYQRKQAKMQWLQNPKQSNVDNRNNVRREASRNLKNKKKEYLKDTSDDLEETNTKSEIIETCIGALVILRKVTSLELI
jgi:hypothetical protein